MASGRRIPDTILGELIDGDLESFRAPKLFGQERSIVIGVPGAFTPVCSQRHVPDFVANAEKLRASGFRLIVVMTPNDPWVTLEWAKQLDPDRRLRFVSDGNLAFSRALGLTIREPDYFVGERSTRFLLTTAGGHIDRLNVEPHHSAFTCTRAVDALADAEGSDYGKLR